MGNINLYKSTTGKAPWTLVKENITSPVTITESTGGSLYYAVRDEGDGQNIEPSNYKIISKPVYVFKSTDKVSKITFDDTTDLNSLIIKVTSTCGNTSNHKVQVQINVKNTGWKNFTQVAIGSNIQAKYTTAATDGVTEGSQIKFRAYIFNTTNANYRTANSAEYVYTFNMDTNVTVTFSNMDADYYYLQASKTGISKVDTSNGIKFFDIQNTTIRLQDTGFLNTQISNTNIHWTFIITIYLSKIGVQKSIKKNITIPNNLFTITIDGNVAINYNMQVGGVLRTKGYTLNTGFGLTFRVANATYPSNIKVGKIEGVCGYEEMTVVTLISVNRSKILYYVAIGDAYELCGNGQYNCIDAVLFSPLYTTETAYNTLSSLSGSSSHTLGARIAISYAGIPKKQFYAVCYIIY